MLRFSLLLLLIAALVPVTGVEAADPNKLPTFKDRRVQYYLGAMQADDQTFTTTVDDVEGDLDIDFSDLPTFGMYFELPLRQDDNISMGVEIGGSMAWRNDDTRFRGTVGGAGGAIAINVDNSLFLADVGIGPFLRFNPNGKVQFYASAGAMLAYGKHEVEDDESEEPPPEIEPAGVTIIISDDSGSGFAAGFFAKAGVEFMISNRSRLGIGARYSQAEIDFDDTVGDVDIDATQVFVSLTTNF